MRYVSSIPLLTLLLMAVLCSSRVFGGTTVIIPIIVIDWVSTAGTVSAYGSDPAQGWIRVFASVEEWAEGWCVFMIPPLEHYGFLGYLPSYNFTLHVARIVNTSIVKLDCNGSDLLIRGFWEVNSVMNPATFTDVSGLLQNTSVKPGELSITGNWSSFIINIEGCESIYGNITSHFVREIQTKPWGWRYPYGDINDDGRINMRDVGAFCRAFGSYLGHLRYDFRADIDFDFIVTMRDIGVCARGFGWSC